MEPAKKTTPSAPDPTSCTNPGNGPMKKQADPMAKPAAIHRSHAARATGRGAPASEWPIKRAPGSHRHSIRIAH
jgi:hypothetical protein